METRTFRAATMLEALQAVQKELGPDALVISMRELESGPTWQPWRKPCCEIVAARSNKKRPAAAALPMPRPASTGVKTMPIAQSELPGESLQAAVRASVAAVKNEARPAVKPTTTSNAGARAARPFKPEVLSTRNSTMTWIVGNEDTLPAEPARPQIAEAPAVKTPERESRLEMDEWLDADKDEIEETAALAKLRRHLLKQGIDESLVERLIKTSSDTLSPVRLADAGYMRNFLKKQLTASLRSSTRSLTANRSVIFLIGQNGVGKTSVCAKLAAQAALQEGKKVAWIEANTVRTGAIAEARMITESLGVTLHLAYTLEDLVAGLAASQDCDLVLVDTAGCNPRREANLVQLGELLTSVPSRTTLMVCGATTKEADLRQTLAAFSPFHLDGLAVTQMDETQTFGSVYNLAWQSKLPLACFSTGPAAMDGLKPGTAEYLVNAIFNEGI